MSIKCIAIDDEPLGLELIASYATRLPQIELVQQFVDAISAGEYLRNSDIDLVFCDINMPDVNGLDLVRSLENPPTIIFTTAYKKFAHEGFELNAVDYLVKPISFERFEKACDKAVEYHQFRKKKDDQSSLFVYVEYRLVKINLSEILYIESLEDYVRIHLLKEKPMMTLMTMKSLTEKLPTDQFQRIHRSYIVAVNKVKSIQNKKATLISGDELPISQTYSSFIQDWKEH